MQVNSSAFSGHVAAAALAQFSFGRLSVNNSVFRDVSVHCFDSKNTSVLVNILTGNVVVNNSLVRAVSTAGAGLFLRATQIRLENSEIELFWPAERTPSGLGISPLSGTLERVSVSNCNLVFRCGGSCLLNVFREDESTTSVV